MAGGCAVVGILGPGPALEDFRPVDTFAFLCVRDFSLVSFCQR